MLISIHITSRYNVVYDSVRQVGTMSGVRATTSPSKITN